MSNDTLLDTKAAAEFLTLSPSSLETWRTRGGGPPFVRVGQRSIRYRREDLERFITAGQRRNTSNPGDSEAAA